MIVHASKCNDVPAQPFDLIPDRPGAKSVTLSVLSHDDADGLIAYSTVAGKLDTQTAKRQFRNGPLHQEGSRDNMVDKVIKYVYS